MNYIKSLQADKAELEARIKRTDESLEALLMMLNGPKFTGVESDGGRKDWIATGDVIAWARDVRSELR